MVKINPDTLKEAAKNAHELMEAAPPEVRMLLEHPQFALGLCLVLHKELVQVREDLETLKAGGGVKAPVAARPPVPEREARPAAAQESPAPPQQALPKQETPPSAEQSAQPMALPAAEGANQFQTAPISEAPAPEGKPEPTSQELFA